MAQTIKSFKDLFRFKDDILIAVVDIIINGVEYSRGEAIAESKYPTFDLLDNPELHAYIMAGKVLKGRISRK